MKAFVYILRCGDGSFYTGWTNNLEKRVQAHQAGKGAKYTRTHLPVELIYAEEADSREAAMSREYAIKQLSRADKIKFLQERGVLLHLS